MMHSAQGEPAVILGARALGEADLLVVLLTARFGKVKAAARNARKSRRRFPGGLTGGAIGEARLVMRVDGLARLEGFTPHRDHSGLGRDLLRFAYVAYLCELTDRLLHEPDPDAPLFTALYDAISRTMDQVPQAVVLRRYELLLLQALGLLPALDDCAICGERLPPGPTVRFDEQRGGGLCVIHGPHAGRVPEPVLEMARRLVQATGESATAAALADTAERPASDRRGLRDLVASWLRPHLRHPLRSREFFAKLSPPVGPRDDS